MVMLVTENELLSAAVNGSGELTFTRENGDVINAGQVRIDITPEIQAARDDAVAAAAAAEAVGNTNDTIMAGVAADSGSEFAGQLSATFATQVRTVRVYKPEEYGAVGDGTTNDTSAMVACYNAARAAKGKVLLTYGKIYTCGSTLNPTGTRTDGDGATIRMIAPTGSSFNIFQPTGGCVIRDLTIDLNKANVADPGNNAFGMGLYAFSSTGWASPLVVTDVEVINGHQIGVRLGASSSHLDALNSNHTPAVLTNLRVSGVKQGIWLQGVRGVTLINPTVTDVTDNGIWDYLSYNTQIIGGTVRNVGTGHGILSQYSIEFSVTGATVENAGYNGICMGGGSDTIAAARNFVISGNRVRGCVASGISIDLTKAGSPGVSIPSYSTVSGNVSNENAVHGMYLHNAQHVSVTGNSCRGNLNGGMSLDSLEVAISGNTLVGNGHGLKFLGNMGTYGSHQVGRNIVTGNTTQNYYYDPVGAVNTALDLSGTGSPEGVLAAPVGSRYMRTDGGAATTLYVKESGGTGNTGWAASKGAN